jgi:hypothetical protein
MVFEYSQKVGLKMNELRQIYLNSSDNILFNLASLEKKRFGTENSEFAVISLGALNHINQNLSKAREAVVNSISNELSLFLSPSSMMNPMNKKVKRFSKKVIEILESSFKKEKYPSDAEKIRLANLCLISAKQVNNWFTNKRNRSKSYKNGYVTYDK